MPVKGILGNKTAVQILEWVTAYCRDKGYGPLQQEISGALFLSESQVSKLVNRLAKAGHVIKKGRCWRGLDIPHLKVEREKALRRRFTEGHQRAHLELQAALDYENQSVARFTADMAKVLMHEARVAEQFADATSKAFMREAQAAAQFADAVQKAIEADRQNLRFADAARKAVEDELQRARLFDDAYKTLFESAEKAIQTQLESHNSLERATSAAEAALACMAAKERGRPFRATGTELARIAAESTTAVNKIVLRSPGRY